MTFKPTLPLIAAGLLAGTVLGGGLYAFTQINDSVYMSPEMDSIGGVTDTGSVPSRTSESTPASGGLLSFIRPHSSADNLSGAFLSSQFAQRHQQWVDAANYLEELQDFHSGNALILKKSIVLEMGANNPAAAIEAAHAFLALDNDDMNSRALAHLFVIADAFKQQDWDAARKQLAAMPDDGLTLFLKPVFEGWTQAMDDKFYRPLMHGHRMHLMNAAYIADFIDDKKQLKAVLAQLSSYDDLPQDDREQVADFYMAAGETKKAREIYEALLQDSPSSYRLRNKLESDAFIPSLSLYKPVDTPATGLAHAVYDMADLLYQDGAYDSARIFTNMALYLHPDLDNAYMLQARLAEEFEDYALAIDAYNKVPTTSPYYFEAQRDKAGAYDDAGQPDKAVALLRQFYKKNNDVQALIQIGDIYRRHEDFSQALSTYNTVVDKHLDGKIPAHYWHIHYVRGMVQEQLGNWEAAKADLEKALEFYPNHPFVLNYLGYAMADRGEDLDKALGMIDQALSMQPHDGYITDSLGWVHYKMGRYDDAVPYLERAVELMPADAVINDHLGDAYWQVGRKLEARYQWKRAKNSASADADLLAAIDNKLANGLTHVDVIQAAQSNHVNAKAITD